MKFLSVFLLSIGLWDVHQQHIFFRCRFGIAAIKCHSSVRISSSVGVMITVYNKQWAFVNKMVCFIWCTHG